MTQTIPNPALLRQYYLQQLGVVAYVARTMHDDSTEIAVVDNDDGSKTRSVNSSEVVSSPEAIPVSKKCESLVETLLDMPLKSRVENHSQKYELESASNDSIEDAISFQLLLGDAGRGVAILAQLPTQALPALSVSERKLLVNILTWLGLSIPAAERFRSYQWPLPGLTLTNRQAGAHGLQMFLEQAASEFVIKNLVVLGSLPLKEQGAGSWQSWVAPSLAEMLKVPELKREASQSLLRLRQMLVAPRAP